MILAVAAFYLLSGLVHAVSGAPIANATVSVGGSHSTPADTRTDAAGEFRIRLHAGRYVLRTRALGFAPSEAGPVVIVGDEAIDITLEPVDAPALRIIGNVEVNGALVPSRALVPAIDLPRSRMDARGTDRIVEALAAIPSVTFAHPDGGNSAAPSVIALRGPDPSETLVALDGQLLNDANTGDLDLSQFPVAAFSNVSITEGLGPSDAVGSNTIGGAVNLVSLRPTQNAHDAFSLSTGSFARSEAWANATGMRRRLGYAFALQDRHEGGYVDQSGFLCVGGAPPCGQLVPIHLGSALDSRTVLANLSWDFSPSAALNVRAFVLGNARDESANVNAPLDAASQGGANIFVGAGPASLAQAIRSYDVRGRAPLGAGSLAYGASISNNDIRYSGSGVSAYDVSHNDRRQSLTLSWQRSNQKSDIAFGGYLRHETLAESGVTGVQSQSIQDAFARGTFDLADRLRVEAALFESHYSTFGASLDGRAGIAYQLSPDSVLRASVGTGFRAPLLIERYLFPIGDLVPDVNGVLVGQGNAAERPEHATEYELGYARRFGTATLDLALYRTNLRDAIENFYPLQAIGHPAPIGTYQSFPINVGNVVYQGVEIHLIRQLRRLLLDARYGINVAYPYNLPTAVANPTSGGNLVNGQQFLGIPQQQGSLGLDYVNGPWHAAAQVNLRGKNNELNQGPFATVDAALGKRIGKTDITLAGSNLTSAASGRFTRLGLGVRYRGQIGAGGTLGDLPTDAKVIEPAAIRLVLTVRN